ncbi:MAG: DUF3043 domain-containing protein [Actinobacteria bacterium]|nr:DUF3043 domain-containing protein [Actinomycetota bacterium]
MFGKSSNDDSTPTAIADDNISVSESGASAAPKGRPTPTRKEAEAARKASMKTGIVPPKSSPKGGGGDKKADRAAQREYARDQRIKAREGMQRGDQRYLPARDQGPVRMAVRDYIDSRRTVAEFFVPVAVVVLILGLMRNSQLQALVTLVWMLIIIVVVTDTGIMLVRMNGKLREQFPDKAERKGVNFYATMRAMQIRRLRLPPPRFKAGGTPVTPKQPKG